MATLNIKVVPGAKANRVVGKYGDGVKLQVSAPPEDGKANLAVILVLAKALAIKPARVTIVRGHGQPRKVVNIEGIDSPELAAWLKALGK